MARGKENAKDLIVTRALIVYNHCADLLATNAVNDGVISMEYDEYTIEIDDVVGGCITNRTCFPHGPVRKLFNDEEIAKLETFEACSSILAVANGELRITYMHHNCFVIEKYADCNSGEDEDRESMLYERGPSHLFMRKTALEAGVKPPSIVFTRYTNKGIVKNLATLDNMVTKDLVELYDATVYTKKFTPKEVSERCELNIYQMCLGGLFVYCGKGEDVLLPKVVTKGHSKKASQGEVRKRKRVDSR